MERALRENEGRRRGVKTLPLAQLELEEGVPMAGWVRKESKGWTCWNLTFRHSVKVVPLSAAPAALTHRRP